MLGLGQLKVVVVKVVVAGYSQEFVAADVGGSDLMAVMGLSRDAELAHRRLVNLILSDGCCFAADHAKTAEIARVPADLWPAVLEGLRGIGWCIRGHRLTHPAVLALQRHARDACAGCRAISAAGNSPR
jgi:hypothetical protein